MAGLCGDHKVYLLDENVEEIDWESLRNYDIVGVTGMTVQKERIHQILLKLREMKIFTVVGGPFVSVKETFFDGLCDVKFIGEVETTWPQFLDDYARDKPIENRYEQTQPTDMTKVPRPRYDHLKVDRYATGALQYSRGCPFECEFCDIIVIFGRKPRVKDPDQLVAELDDMRRAGFHSVFIVDDNFIGNKKKAKALLEKLIPWMEQHNYPLRLTTEASIDLANDPELLELMYRANFRSVFIGIETPRLESLNETKKFPECPGRHAGGQAGREFRMPASTSMPGSSSASTTTTRKYSRISSGSFKRTESRWRWSACCRRFPKRRSTNGSKQKGVWSRKIPTATSSPSQMSREELRQGYWDLVKRLYAPEAFLRSLLQGLPVSRVSPTTRRDLQEGRGRKTPADSSLSDWRCSGRFSGLCCGMAR